MPFCKTIVHIVQPGDSFYRLAQRYQTTIPEIILRNPGVDPYNLQVGTRLSICSGQDQNTAQRDEVEVNNDMRKAWQQHVYWTRMLMTSLLNDLKDQEATEKRLMRTPAGIADVFDRFYDKAIVAQLRQLLEEHTRIGGEIIRATKEGGVQAADELERQWYQNADQIAKLLSSINTDYSYDELHRALTQHLEMLKQQLTASINQEYDEAVGIFDEGEKQILELADYLTEGLLKQFYRS
ncbi:MAG: LysM peptidoglycan-binding domain-containing protein [Lachnospiraceae bacterium]|nr:LysM peptidoglycan-binding domain-containing protein [Lachnospiraceae bacterium]